MYMYMKYTHQILYMHIHVYMYIGHHICIFYSEGGEGEGLKDRTFSVVESSQNLIMYL